MTGRARWLILLGLTGFVLGVCRSQHTLTLLSLSASAWVFFQWLWFQVRLWFELPSLMVSRKVNGRYQDQGILFAGRSIDVEIEVCRATGSIGANLVVEDLLPETVLADGGQIFGRLLVRSPKLTVSWTGKVLAAGQMNFAGVRVTLSDTFGLFSVQRFIESKQKFRIMPGYRQAGDLQPIVKRINSLPSHGIHRLQRAGMGSELLELREYVPGDPPKSIAWKVSARRNTLMTRQYESEVPVRTTLFVDGSIANRLGGFGQRLLDQMLFVAASLARTAASAGDPVGVVTFDETGSRRMKPATGESGFFQLLSHLSDFAVNPQPPLQKLNNGIVNAVLRLAGMRYPELLDSKVNQVPFTWLPISPWKRRDVFRRSQAAAVLAEHYGLTPAHLVRLIQDDQVMVEYSVRFLNQMGLAWMDPVVANRSPGFHDGLSTMQSLNTALAGSVMTARDNEVFVLIANLMDSSAALNTLMPGIKLAIARHHKVVVVCPSATFRRPDRNANWPEKMDAESLLQYAEDLRIAELSDRLFRALRRLGVSVSVSGEESAIEMIAAETELARSGRMRGEVMT